MAEKTKTKEKRRRDFEYHDDLIEGLLKDPTRPSTQMAEELGVSRQTLWRRKKALEENGVVWGYTSVVEDSKIGGILSMILLKTRSLDNKFADLIIKRTSKRRDLQQDVRVLYALQMVGTYDVMILFSSPDLITARKFYEGIRTIFADHLIAKPDMMEVTFPLIAGGKVNPDIHRLKDIIPDFR